MEYYCSDNNIPKKHSTNMMLKHYKIYKGPGPWLLFNETRAVCIKVVKCIFDMNLMPNCCDLFMKLGQTKYNSLSIIFTLHTSVLGNKC